MRFYVCATPYHLFITLCDILDKKEKSCIYLSTHDQNVFNLFQNYEKDLIKFEYVENVYIRKRGDIKERLFIESIIDKIEYRKIKEIIHKSHVIIFPWNPYSLFSPAEYIFNCAKKVTLIEEGANLYSMKEPSKLFLFIKKNIYRRNTDFYKSEKISEIIVQFPNLYPKHLANSLVKLDLEEMTNKLNLEQRNNMIKILANGLELSNFNKEYIIVLTQPLSEDKFITEHEKKNIYYDIIKKYKSNYNVILKKHPREKTIYNYGLEDIIELDGMFPSEIFKLTDVKFKKAIGLCTSAVKFINAEEAFNIDENFIKKLNTK